MDKRLSTDQLNELIDCFKCLKDPRVQGRSKHQFIDIIVITICATLCGAESITEIEEFGFSREKWLRKYLELPNGIPSYDTIARVLSLIESSQMERAFLKWSISISEEKSKTISLDGKGSAGTKSGRSQNILKVVSAYSHEMGLSLVETEAKEGGGEVAATMECLELLDLEGVLTMVDAGIGCRKVVQKIVEKKGDYLVPLKGNQSIYRDEVFEVLDRKKNKIETSAQDGIGHGRGERRECRLIAARDMTEKFYEQWPDAKSIFSVTRARITEDTRAYIREANKAGKQVSRGVPNELRYSEEIMFYVSSRKLTPQEALTETRAHWGIENKVHWVLDVAFREDHWAVRAKKLAKTLSLVRKIALNIIRRSKTEGSVRVRMKKAAWETDFLEELLFI